MCDLRASYRVERIGSDGFAAVVDVDRWVVGAHVHLFFDRLMPTPHETHDALSTDVQQSTTLSFTLAPPTPPAATLLLPAAQARNDADSTRYVLMLRVYHPGLSALERKAMQLVFDTLDEPVPRRPRARHVSPRRPP